MQCMFEPRHTVKNHRVIIEISPSRLELAVVRSDRVVAWSVERFDRSEWPDTWRDAIDDLAGPLAAFVTEHGVLGWPATVIGRLPSGNAQVSSGPLRVPTGQQQDAARLAAAAAINDEVEADDAEVVILASDRESGATPQRHILAYAQADAVLTAVETLLTRCRLVPAGYIPEDAVVSREVARAARASSDAVAALWIGDHQSMLAVSTAEELRFVRSIGVGSETFVEALTRPIRRPGESAASVCLPRRHARRLLADIGVPAPESEIPGLDGFTGASILPLIQPLVQRMSLELRQSIRFSVAAEVRDQIGIEVLGPGAALCGLSAAIAAAASIPARTDARPATSDASVSGAIAAAASTRSLPVLLSRDLRRNRTVSRTRRAILAGVGAALAIIGAEWFDARAAVERLRAQADAARLVQAQRQADAEALAAALNRLRTINETHDRIHRLFGDGPDAPAAIAAIGSVVPAAVTLSDLELHSDPKAPKAVVRGALRLRPGTDAGATIRDFVSSLTALPVATQARLGRTARVSENGLDQQTFEITIDLVAIPSATRAGLASAVEQRSVP